MPPRDLAPSTLGFQYPKNRDVPNKNVDLWLEDKRRYDGADGFWRVHDDLYDLTDFIDVHPGGKTWLELTKGTDITEAFEAHHISTRPEGILKTFHVRKAESKRHAPYTFKEDGFYMTLKRNVRNELQNLPKNQDAWKSNLMTDALMYIMFLLAILACKFWSIPLVILAGIFLCSTTIAGHNYFHRKDNFRMYYFDLSLMSSRDWRISHALSHHLLTNTIYDLEISMFEPALEYLPTTNKKYLSLVMAPLQWLILFHKSYYMRVTAGKFGDLSNANLVPLSVPIVMYIFGGQSIIATFLMWNAIVFVASFNFGFIGLNAAHHHPDIFHDGDTVREDMDWGINQLDTIMDRIGLCGSPFWGLIYFGDHALHHFFPTLDHGILQHLYPTFCKTAKEFGVDLRTTTQLELVKGQFKQLLRDKPNPNVPDLLKYSRK